jgi:hypothetical protein
MFKQSTRPDLASGRLIRAAISASWQALGIAKNPYYSLNYIIITRSQAEHEDEPDSATEVRSGVEFGDLPPIISSRRR